MSFSFCILTLDNNPYIGVILDLFFALSIDGKLTMK
jgi:hypothetical protein